MDQASRQKKIEDRVDYLEENRRYIQNALEMALSIGDFQEQINQVATPAQVLAEADKKVCHLMIFRARAFYLVDPESSDFVLSHCDPPDRLARIEDEMTFMINKGLVAWAIRERKGVILPSRDYRDQVLLHIVATNSRVRGMFVGLVADNADAVPDVSRDLLSIVLRNTANALESIEHYERIKAEKLLKESKERIEAILFSVPTGIVILDSRTLRVVDANAKALETIGCSAEDLRDNDYLRYSSLSREEYHRIASDGRGREHFEGTLVDHTGRPVPVLKSVIPAIVGEQESLIESFIDIRDRIDSEKERLQKEKLQGVIELAGAVCHEMNQPMQSVSGQTDLLLLEANPEEPVYKRVKAIAEQVERMGEVTRKLMSITRYETKAYPSGHIFDIEKAIATKKNQNHE
jgi:PAS domain S-box-containing protein